MNADFPTLRLEGLPDLDPYAYNEDLDEDEGVLTISARIRVSPEVGESLKARWLETRGNDDPGYFNVTRVGRDEEPRLMRFGQPFWSSHDDHEKHELTLVDRAYDKDEPKVRWPQSPQEMKETANVINLVEQMDGLLSLLVDRGVITKADAQGLREVPDEQRWQRFLDFRRVDDLDDWA